ncbi:phosphoglycerate mutase (2,3-diphosphoglycerate-independent) [Candidatus Collierbacteria bacterium RIFCSPLOWO2_01_FULL_50_23]|uniref:2,3-bisphosphoglycerate-independent phosphoglycerate mutase n=1 Tax=Candidatus Collierbacteria bacterium RIFCSPHIGHO2_02_FULL_49_10 TaxID=1817723 RepID=A0A1F5EX47_9BACT|nr:MAG: phosphoglycerate mutase (2,3-diphosphoglycerate-independent) [Candidatus Collierbacteria bacterium RIFCSPHIGHO2_02_FULL_49_10]OGD75157.1 MAG: phosphoglycerate mutase (2,3-diphosphoglycerate-independent) [Candidatus Collierbacteria bacterium RIFCSPLOWO2_01_FULL_50_23]
MPAKRVILCIMDGWGIAPASPGNSITLADPPTFKNLEEHYPHSQLEASGIAVGLPAEQDGNTETGHLNIGAGRIVYQDLARINMSIAEGSFFMNPALLEAISHAKTNNSSLHLLGMIGSSGVHASNDHLYALIMMASQHKIEKVYLHLITDGRDSPPTNGIVQIRSVEERLKRYISTGKVASIMGRYYAMDRDMRLDRTHLASDCLVGKNPTCIETSEKAIQDSYDRGETDEFIKPVSVGGGCDQTRIKANDAVIFYNFRIDRPRQLTKTLLDAHTPNLKLVTMTKYHKNFNVPVAFPDIMIKNSLGEVISAAGLKQLRAAESEKERFVTYYFNGQHEEEFPGEDRLIVPSPKIATYDLQPEMSTPFLVDAFCQAFAADGHALGVINIACPDMVAHTGNVEKTVLAIKAADTGLAKLVELANKLDIYLLMTGDHGNAEELLNRDTGEVDTEHSLFPVPLVLNAKEALTGKLENGVLADIAPTILALLGIQKPSEMTGKNLYT